MVWQCRSVKDYLVIDANETLSKVIPMLKKDKQVLVFDKDKYLGIATRKNVLKEGINLPEEKVSNLVFKPPAIFEDTSELNIAKYFLETGAHYLPVFDNKDKTKISCVLYRVDFLKDIIAPYMHGIKVSQIANTNVKTIHKDDNLAKALASFHDLGISKLLVYNGKLDGVITISNILGYFMGSTQISKSALQNTLVKDVMKNEVISVNKIANVTDVINLFVDKNVSSVIVLDENNNLFGIVSKADILEQYIFAVEQEAKESSIQISAKFPGLSRPDIEKKLEQLEKYNEDSTKIFAYYKMGKEKFKGLPLISCRVRVVAPKKMYTIHVEGWGVEHATELAVEKLKRQMGDVRF